MDDEISSGEGAQPPNELKPVRRRRSRKLSGPTAQALGELAFAMYAACDPRLSNEQFRGMLKAKLLAWRAAFLP